jgi:ribonuclease Z
VDLFVTFLGTSASTPTAARGTSATLIARGGDRWLVDCGEGTQRQLLRSGIGLVDIDAILLTHLHGDHYLGLPGILKTFALREREKPLTIVGPPGLNALFKALRQVFGRVTYDLTLQEVEAGLALEAEGARIEAFPTSHTVPSTGFALTEAERPGAFDVAAARALGVPEGPDFGALQQGRPVTTPAGREVRPNEVLGPARSGRTVVLTGDTEPCPTTLNAARGASLLVHEATFLDEDRARARETRHSTAAEAAALARDADVALLALTHVSSRCAPREVRREARAVFDRWIVPRAFEQVEIP